MKIEFTEGAICPICKVGKLIIRRGKFGDFLGCDQYPSCTFVQKTNKKERQEDRATEEWVRNHGATIDSVI